MNAYPHGPALLFAAALLTLLPQPGAAEPRVVFSAGKARPGDVVLVAVTGENDAPPPSGRWLDKPLVFFRASSWTYLALLGFDLELATGTYRLELETRDAAGVARQWGRELPVEPRSFPTRNITVDQKYVTPKEDDEERARLETDRLTALYAAGSAENYLRGNFLKPIPRATSARFGERRIFNKVPKAPHGGADLRAPAGTPVRAPAGGRVALTGDFFYQGKTVVLDHGHGLFSSYIHLSEISAKEGAVLARGDLLGKVGRTGRASGPHLHWSVRLHGARVDPFALLPLDLDRYLGAAARPAGLKVSGKGIK